MWVDIAIVATLFAAGSILFGHFEERTPKWRRLLKLAMLLVVTGTISSTLGRVWTFSLIGAIMGAAAVAHLWWLPKHGINPWSGEPREKYYALRGWTP